MTNLVILIIILVLTGWLGGLVIQFGKEVTSARRRYRSATDKERKLQGMIEAMLAEEQALTVANAENESANAALQAEIEATRTGVSKRMATGGKRLLVMTARRQPGDREWLITLANPTHARNEPQPALVQEWTAGREYLVYARTEMEAQERALRRYNTRSGIVIKSIVAAPADLLTGDTLNSLPPTVPPPPR